MGLGFDACLRGQDVIGSCMRKSAFLFRGAFAAAPLLAAVLAGCSMRGPAGPEAAVAAPSPCTSPSGTPVELVEAPEPAAAYFEPLVTGFGQSTVLRLDAACARQVRAFGPRRIALASGASLLLDNADRRVLDVRQIDPSQHDMDGQAFVQRYGAQLGAVAATRLRYTRSNGKLLGAYLAITQSSGQCFIEAYSMEDGRSPVPRGRIAEVRQRISSISFLPNIDTSGGFIYMTVHAGSGLRLIKVAWVDSVLDWTS